VRIIAASSSSLQKLVNNASFREDLYYRLYVYPICIPSLEERRDDIPLLAEFFLHKFAAQQKKNLTAFDLDILRFMRFREWKGHVRELENFIERLVALAPPEKKTVSRSMLPTKLKEEIKEAAFEPEAFPVSVKQAILDYEKQLYLQALERNDWNKSQTARYLNMSERMLRYNMQRLGIQKP
jgi:DNA-binding NtrC family response regulator